MQRYSLRLSMALTVYEPHEPHPSLIVVGSLRVVVGRLSGALFLRMLGYELDITVGLALDRCVPDERLRIVLGGVKPRQIKYFGVDLDGVELRATDLDWAYRLRLDCYRRGTGSFAGALRAETASRTVARRAQPVVRRAMTGPADQRSGIEPGRKR